MNDPHDNQVRAVASARLTRMVIALIVVSLGAFVAALARLRLDTEVSQTAGDGNLQRLIPYWCTFALTWAGLTALWSMLRNRERVSGFLRSSVVILSVAVAARIVVLALHQPTLSDDVYRYIFDGRNLTHGVNPYLARPDDAATESDVPVAGDLAKHINNPELFTIYLPTSQYMFAAAAAITNDAQAPHEMSTVFRAGFVGIEVLGIVFVLLALRHAKSSPWWAALYAWHPLPIAEIAGSGHQDAIGLVLLTAAILVIQLRPARTTIWTTVLACASLVKPIVIPIAVFALRGKPLRTWFLSLLTGAVVVTALAVPVLATHDWQPLENLRATATRFSFKWAHLGSMYEPMLWIIERIMPSWGNDAQELVARGICTAILGVVMLVILLRVKDICRAAAYMLLAMVLLTPAAHPWYVLWSLVLLPRTRLLSVWCASLTLSWGYAAFGYWEIDGELKWAAPAWLMIPAYGPVYAALLYDIMSRRKEE